MERLTDHVQVQTRGRGGNHGIVTTSDGLVMIDTPYKPSEALRLREELAGAPPLRYMINTEPHADHWTGNGFFDAPVAAHEGVRRRMLGIDPAEHRARLARLGPGEGDLLEGYRLRPPTLIFTDQMTIHLGAHSFRLIHMPGHTPFQAAVVVEEEGVVFTSDNVFGGVRTWLQEADPEAWLRSLDAIRALGIDTLVPGHGSICNRAYLDTQAEVIREWVGTVREAIDRGLSREEAIEQLSDRPDRFPMASGQEGKAVEVARLNVANLWDFATRTGIHAPNPGDSGAS